MTGMVMVAPMDFHDPGHIILLQVPQSSTAQAAGTTTHVGAGMPIDAATPPQVVGTMVMYHPTAAIPKTGASRGERANGSRTNTEVEAIKTIHGDALPQEIDPKLKLDLELKPKSGMELSPPWGGQEEPGIDLEFEEEGRGVSEASRLDNDSREEEVKTIAISDSNSFFAMVLAGLTSLRGLHPMSGRLQRDEESNEALPRTDEM